MNMRVFLQSGAWLFATAALGLGILVGSDLSADDAAPQAASSLDADYHRLVVPMLKNYCVDCHGPLDAEAGFRLDDLNADLLAGPNRRRWTEARSRILAGEMPPPEAAQPSPRERAAVADWIGRGLIEASRSPRRHPPPQSPHMGNRVPHDLLFRKETSSVVTASPARRWRISPQIYHRLLVELDPVVKHEWEYRIKFNLLVDQDTGRVESFAATYNEPFSSPSGGFSDYSGSFTIDESAVPILIANAQAVVARQTAYQTDDHGEALLGRGGRLQQARGRRVSRPEYDLFLALLHPNREPTSDEMEEAIRAQFRLVSRREPAPQELALHLEFMRRNIQQVGRTEGVRATLAGILLRPEVYFRSELGEGEPDEHGRQMLGPREVADALAYALTDLPPDDALLEAAAAGELASREGIKAHAERMLADAALEKPRILRFFREYFGYTAARIAFKDDAAVKQFQERVQRQPFRWASAPEATISDTDLLIQHILAADRNVLHELLTTNKTFVNYNPQRPDRPKNHYAQRSWIEPVYNLPEWPGENQPVSLPREERAGILTQPSWLIANSFNELTDPIHRGKWVRENLLGGVIYDIPPGVEATIPDEPDRTMRERLRHTTKASCWECHQKMNPLGLPFEMYDAFGRFRTEELGRPLDASGEIGASGDAKLDGKVDGAVGMLRRLADSDHVRQVFVRHAFRYWMGRAETLNDAPTLVAADRAYVKSGGSMKALILSLLTSDSFLYRVPLDSTPLRTAGARSLP